MDTAHPDIVRSLENDAFLAHAGIEMSQVLAEHPVSQRLQAITTWMQDKVRKYGITLDDPRYEMMLHAGEDAFLTDDELTMYTRSLFLTALGDEETRPAA